MTMLCIRRAVPCPLTCFVRQGQGAGGGGVRGCSVMAQTGTQPTAHIYSILPPWHAPPKLAGLRP